MTTPDGHADRTVHLIERIEALLEPWEAPLCGPSPLSMNWPGKVGGCHFCDARVARLIEEETGDPFASWSRPMIVCVECGNKRCPKASWHRSECTGSNKSGQEAPYPKEPTLEDVRLLVDTLKFEIGQ